MRLAAENLFISRLDGQVVYTQKMLEQIQGDWADEERVRFISRGHREYEQQVNQQLAAIDKEREISFFILLNAGMIIMIMRAPNCQLAMVIMSVFLLKTLIRLMRFILKTKIYLTTKHAMVPYF